MNTLSMTPGAATLAAGLAQAPADAADRGLQRRLRRAVLLPALVAAALLAAWSAVAPLAGAVIAAGQVQAEFGRKQVQHQEGGLLRALYVRPGQPVRRGDALLVVGDLRSDAALELLRRQQQAERLRAARATAELALAGTVDWPADARAAAYDASQREQQLFETRRRALDDRVAALQAQQMALRAQQAALEEQAAAAQSAAALAGTELETHRPLVEAGFIQKTRLMGLERSLADARGRSAAARGQAAQVRGDLAALANAVAQARADYRRQAADELKEAGARLAELEERLRPGVDQVERQTVRAPVDGVVMGLRVSAPGTAVGPRETLLEIAPSDETLVVETRIEPQDVAHVQVGGDALVRLAAYEQRRVPPLPARVRAVSPDALADADGRSHYRAQVEVPAAELARHPELRLRAGMPAEVFVTTAPRSLLEYLLEPLGLFARRAMREP
ncbi:MAG: HlyD family type I secretion periplasmic adaptor subunit [Piscinibacter sp.]|uniref:HlyD family type I secretion periplasmic adaptor subunit n=1 Tax=Piscinibacter sp. TaxID=1903157 RepID=UPI0025880507|nr:HlyD family type I secretion periplasmic adaptor subunit [Piscinibacter sp.]MCW5665283.1 HlyD family type I secretion periplasmic adaptor subunit [Piscinibacter sp.]